LECLFDQQAAEARAIDEQIAFDRDAVLHRDRGDMARPAVERDIRDLAFAPHHAVPFRIGTQEARVAGRVDMIGVVGGGQIVAAIVLGPGELAEIGGHGFEAESLDRSLVPALAQAVPDVLEGNPADFIAIAAEGVDVALADVAPVHELDAELERALRRGEHLPLVDIQQVVEFEERRDCRFAYAHGPDLLGFHERDVDCMAGLQPRQRGSGHPARGSTPNDNDFSYTHPSSLPVLPSCCQTVTPNCERSYEVL
jgi:hypothetical protein